MPTQIRRTKRIRESTTWAAVIAALVVHGTVLGSVEAFELSLVRDGFTARGRTTPAEVERALQTTCSGDVLLATAARAALCLAPWRDDVEGCSDDVVMTMWMDLSSCQARGDETRSPPRRSR